MSTIKITAEKTNRICFRLQSRRGKSNDLFMKLDRQFKQSINYMKVTLKQICIENKNKENILNNFSLF